MQAEFKQEQMLKARQIKAESDDKIRKANLQSDIAHKIESSK